jgi:hypothetical protein
VFTEAMIDVRDQEASNGKLGRKSAMSPSYVSLAMAAGTGYVIATMRQGAFDFVAGLAFVSVLVGAMIKMALKILFEHEGRKAA